MQQFYANGLAMPVKTDRTTQVTVYPPRHIHNQNVFLQDPIKKIVTPRTGINTTARTNLKTRRIEDSFNVASATVREVFDVSSRYPRDLFDTGSGAVREVFDCCSGGSRRTTEAHPKQYRSCPEPVPKRTRSAPEGHPNSTRRNRLVFHRFFDVLKAGIKYRCSKDVVLFTQLLRKIAEAPLMYRKCTVSVRGVYRKGTGDLLRSYWRSTTDLLNACTSGVDQRYSKSRRVVGVEAMTNKAIPLMTVWLCFMLFNLSDAWAQSAEPRTAEGQIETKPLKIGDTIPEEVWDMPLQLVKYNEAPKAVKLADYRGKVIIFDYWATWCLGCIMSMPKVHELVEGFHDDVVLLPVTDEDENLISNYLKVTASKQMQALRGSFSTIVSGQPLKDLIPHRTIPHIAIINAQGVLEQITMPHLIDRKVLLSIIKQEEYYLPKYRGKLDSTLLSPSFPELNIYRPQFYSAVDGYKDGFNNNARKYQDTSASITRSRGHYVNTALLRLFHIALRPKFDAMIPSRRLMLLDKPEVVDYFHERNPNYNRKKFDICYEYCFPGGWSQEQIRSRMRKDLEDFTGYRAFIIEREVPVLLLRSVGDGPDEASDQERRGIFVKGEIWQTRVPQKLGRSSSGAVNYLLSAKMNELVAILNGLKHTSMPFVIDSTNIDYKIDLDLPDDIGDIEMLSATLERQGIEVKIEKRMLELFAMTDKDIVDEEFIADDIKLTKFGYVLKRGGEGGQ